MAASAHGSSTLLRGSASFIVPRSSNVRYLFAQNLLESGDHFLHYIASWQLGCTRGWMAVTDTESVGRVHDVQELPSSNTLGSATLTMRSCFGLCSVKRIRWVSIVIT
jgi:hypothetical protein